MCRIADFNAVAEGSVVATCMHRGVSAAVGRLVASVGRTGDVVIAIGCGTGLAAVGCVTCLHAVAMQVIAAKGVAGDVIAAVGCLVAGVQRAGDVVVAIDRRAFLATVDRIADFIPIAILAVGASRVVGHIVAGIGALVA